MKANELRVGNWYKDRDSENYWQITGQDIFSIHEGMDSECWQPIPLTPGILEKAGFKNKQTKWRNLYKKDYVVLDANLYSSFTCSYCYGYRGIIGIDFVHQLQNIYFTLTGEELQIEL